ncbi:MAG: SURF1 family protein, partial [Hyphomicrobiales bacterium]
TLDLDEWEYRPVSVEGTYDFSAEFHAYTIVSEPRGTYSGPGYWIFTPLNLAGGGAVMVNRGFVPERFKLAKTRAAGQLPGRQRVVGLLRKTEVPGTFALAADLKNNVWTVRDLPAMTRSLGRADLAPFLIDAKAIAPGFLPQGGETRLKFVNNHLDYALTWYGLGIVLLGVYLAFHRAQGRFGKPHQKAKNP